MPRPPSLADRALQSRDVIELLSSKWRVTVLHVLQFGPRRANDLARAIRQVSPKVLTQTLRGMERDGLIDRRVRALVPAHVEYALTDTGAEAVSLLKPLCLWAEKNATKRDEARARYDRSIRTPRGAPRSR